MPVDTRGTARAIWQVAVATLMLLPIGPGGDPLQAQHVLRGQVVDTTGTGLPGVEIVLAEAERRGVTDSGGRFALWNIPTGRYEVVFRRLGYSPLAMFRSFMGDTGTTVVEVRLAAEAVVLPEVETKARGPEAVPVKLREWARRREFNVGGSSGTILCSEPWSTGGSRICCKGFPERASLGGRENGSWPWAAGETVLGASSRGSPKLSRGGPIRTPSQRCAIL